MIKLTVLYGHPTDPDAFEKYYAETHTPLALKIPNLKRFEVAKCAPNSDGTRPAFYRVADLWFDDLAQFQAGLASPEGQAATADVANFASGGATLLVSETTVLI